MTPNNHFQSLILAAVQKVSVLYVTCNDSYGTLAVLLEYQSLFCNCLVGI